jgi:GNAT superfamily N-acetyltransferase
MAVEIRQLGPGDAAAFHSVRLQGLRESPEAFGSTYEEEVGSSLDLIAQRLEPAREPTARVVLGAFADDALVGVVGCHQEAKAKARHKAVIWGMYVVPEMRGRGLGRQLLRRAIAEARTWPNVERMTITVVERVHQARELYLSAGFQPFGREPDALRQNGVSDVMEYLSLPLIAPTGKDLDETRAIE